MGKCAAKKCNSETKTVNKSSGITFHKVPQDVRREKWVKVIRLLRKETDWLPNKFSVICSKHFRDEDKIETNRGRIFLSRKAIPVLPDDSHSEQPSIKEENMNEDILVDTDEEMEEILETPREHGMRDIIRRLQVVSARRLKKLRSAVQRSRRLKKRNKQLKEIIKELKKKLNFLLKINKNKSILNN